MFFCLFAFSLQENSSLSSFYKSPAKKWKFSSLRPPGGYHTLFDLLHLFKVQARPLYIVGSGGKPMPFIGRRRLTLLRLLRLLSSMVVVTRTILAGSISFMLIEAGGDWPHSILHRRRISATTRIDWHKGSRPRFGSVFNIHDLIILFLSRQVERSRVIRGHDMENLGRRWSPGLSSWPMNIHWRRGTELHRGRQFAPTTAQTAGIGIIVAAWGGGGRGGAGSAWAPDIQPRGALHRHFQFETCIIVLKVGQVIIANDLRPFALFGDRGGWGHCRGYWHFFEAEAAISEAARILWFLLLGWGFFALFFDVLLVDNLLELLFRWIIVLGGRDG